MKHTFSEVITEFTHDEEVDKSLVEAFAFCLMEAKALERETKFTAVFTFTPDDKKGIALQISVKHELPEKEVVLEAIRKRLEELR